MIDRKPRMRRRPAFQVESLENRGLLSVLAPTPTVPAEVHSASQLVPLKGNFEGTAQVSFVSESANSVVDSVESTASGRFSHLGQSTIQAHEIDTINLDTGFAVVTDGSAILTAANGDQLFLDYGGRGVPNGVGFDDTYHFTVDGGTGRFAEATGGGVVQSTDVPGANHPFVAVLDGVISSVGSNRR
ncbi:MAG: hypothetical protein JO252_11150 [Planctomycetaceae bacterium]|nr:hypothetical protein [Planctomycetaceae bacterium]